MKRKILLGTTALVAAGFMTTGIAQAEEGITAGVGGYINSAMGFVEEDSGDGEIADGDPSTSIANDIEISVSGSTTLDNGLTVGLTAMIEGNGTGDNSEALDERWAYFSSPTMGTIKIGQVESARQAMTRFSPNGGAPGFGVNSPFWFFGDGQGIVNVRTYDDGLGTEDSLKVVYTSPAFNGITLGASYSPTDNGNGDYSNLTSSGDAVGGVQDNLALSAEIVRDMGGFSLSAMIAHESYVLEQCNASEAIQTCQNNPEVTQFGAIVSFGNFSIGGGVQDGDIIANATSGAEIGRSDWDIGMSYNLGNGMAVGIATSKAEVDQADGTTDTLQLSQVDASYVLGPGISVGAAIQSGEFDDASPGTGLDNNFTVFGISSGISF